MGKLQDKFSQLKSKTSYAVNKKSFLGFSLLEIVGNILTFTCLVVPLCCGAIGWAGYADTHGQIMWNMEIAALTFSIIGIFIAIMPTYGQLRKELAAKDKLALPRFIVSTSLSIFAFVFVLAITIFGLRWGHWGHVASNVATTNLNYFATSYTAVVIVKTIFSGWLI